MSTKSFARRLPLNGRVIMAAVMLAIFLAMVLMAGAYPNKSRLLPWVIGIPGTLMALAQLIKEIADARGAGDVGIRAGQSEEEAADSAERLNQEWILVGYLVLLVVSHLLLGFWIASPLFVAVFLRLYEGASWRVVILSAAATWLTLFAIFDQLLAIGVFDGFLPPYVMDLFGWE